MRPLRLWLSVLLAAIAATAPAAAGSKARAGFDGWSTVIVQADWRDSRGHRIAAFDNARRDLAAGFRAAGLPGELITEVNLDADLKDAPEPPEALRRVAEAGRRGSAGCLVYFTSHGGPDGMVFGDGPMLAPDQMAHLIRNSCGERPTVVVISACFSGVFIDGLRARNRMILTAARRDRASFGCGADERYPWFDGCVLESLPEASDFLALAALTRGCVAKKETELGAAPASEPQLNVGADMQLRLPTMRFMRSGG